MRDSDEDDLHDRDYDVAALANNLSQAFRYSIYDNEDAEEVFVDSLYNFLAVPSFYFWGGFQTHAINFGPFHWFQGNRSLDRDDEVIFSKNNSPFSNQ